MNTNKNPIVAGMNESCIKVHLAGEEVCSDQRLQMMSLQNDDLPSRQWKDLINFHGEA